VEIEDVIAETAFQYDGQPVIVAIRRPVPRTDGPQFACHFSVEGGPIKHVGRAIGYDSMQSLILALRFIGTFLSVSNGNFDASKVEWQGGEMHFPVFDSVVRS